MDPFVLVHKDRRLWYGTFLHIAKAGFVNAVSTRLGGISSGSYGSLNLALHVGDDQQNVITNRRIFCKALGLDFSRLTTAQQVHADGVEVIKEQHAGKGSLVYDDSLPNTDALITNVPNIPIMLCYADCVPIIIADPVNRAVGVVHAGWKGTVALIVRKTIQAMQKEFGTAAKNCLAGIGPAIGPCCYQVDSVVVDKLIENFSEWQTVVTACNGMWNLDLWKANRLQLEQCGIPELNIVSCNICTSCNRSLFYSYRADEKITGRLAAAVVIPG